MEDVLGLYAQPTDPQPQLAPQPAYAGYVLIGCGVVLIIAGGVVLALTIFEDLSGAGIADDPVTMAFVYKLAERGIELLRTPAGGLRVVPAIP